MISNFEQRVRFLPIGILFLWCIFMVWLFYPGYMSTDSYNQLMQGRGATPFADAHPIILARLWGVLDAIVAGPSLMLFLQIGLLSWGIFQLVRQFLPSPALQSIVLLIVLFAPPVFSIVGIIWKDIWMWISLIWALVAFTRVMLDQEGAVAVRLTCGLIALVLAALCRANAIGASLAIVVMMAVFLIWLWPRGLRLRILTAASLIVGLPVLYVLGLQLVQIDIEVKKRNFDTITMGFDLSGMSVAANKRLIDKGYLGFISDDTTIEDIKARYSPRYHACLYRECKGLPPILKWTQIPDDLSHIRANWLQTIIDHPMAWLTHRLRVSSQILNYEGTRVWAPILRGPFSGSAKKMGYVWDTDGRKAVRAAILKFSGLTHSPYRYFLVACIMAMLLFVLLIISDHQRRQRLAILMILVSGVSYQFTIILAATSPDYRYSQPMISFTIIAVLLYVSMTYCSRVRAC